MSARLFVGVRIPPVLHDRLTGLQSGVPGARWVTPENFHITLSFLGDIEESRFEDLHECLAGVSAPPFDVTLNGTGAFGSKAPKLLWAGLEPCPELKDLQGTLAGRLARAGFLSETRKYSPHVTLAYLNPGRHSTSSRAASSRSASSKAASSRANGSGPDQTTNQWFEHTAPFLAAPFTVTHFTLIESRLGSRSSSYSDLEDYPLAQRPQGSDPNANRSS